MLPWLPWSTDAFQRAHRDGRPLLLSIVTGWSAACARMDVEVFADPAVLAAVQAHAVPVRVDADQRPDIADRYGLGGWPTTVWLTPQGEMLRGGTYVDAATLLRELVDVAARFQRDRVALVQRAGELRAARDPAAAQKAAAPEPMTLAQIRDCLLQEFDAEYGGFGHGEKFPLAAPILFAVRAGALAQDPDLLTVAEVTLDRIAESDLIDRETGAFHRACAARDWTLPDRACLLDVQAEMIAVYLEASEVLHAPRYRTRALAALEYVERQLRDANGGLRHYEHGPILTDSNARMIRTLVYASHVLGDNHWILAAIDIAEYLVTKVYVPASGVAHSLRPAIPASAASAATTPGATSADAAADARSTGAGPAERAVTFGLLADAILLAGALLDLGQAAGRQVYAELSEELGRSSLRRFWDSSAGALTDRIRTTAGAGDVGLLGEALHPFGINVEAARLLGKLAGSTGDSALAARASALRRYVSVMASRQGILAADYGLLLLELGQDAA